MMGGHGETMREKLIELLESVPHAQRLYPDLYVDHLIANGVTIPVRCKDCKHYDNSEGICWCHLNSKFFPGGMDWHGFPEDGFCSYGERRSDE